MQTSNPNDISSDFIKAAKSSESFEEVLSVYSINYFADCLVTHKLDALVEILANIVQALKPISLDKILSEMLIPNRWKGACIGLEEETPLNEVMVRYLIAEIRNTDLSKIVKNKLP